MRFSCEEKRSRFDTEIARSHFKQAFWFPYLDPILPFMDKQFHSLPCVGELFEKKVYKNKELRQKMVEHVSITQTFNGKFRQNFDLAYTCSMASEITL